MTGITKDHEIVTQRLKVKKINFVGLAEGGSLAVRGKGKSIVKIRCYLPSNFPLGIFIILRE